jgi:hypothetical protein
MEHGSEGFSALLANSADALTYKWKQLVRRFGESNDLTGQTKAVELYLSTLASARGTGPVDSLRWGQALARVSRMTDIPVEELNRRFRVGKTKPISRQPSDRQEVTDTEESQIGFVRPGPLTAADRAERFILGILLNEPKRWQQVQQHVQPAQFNDRLRQQLAERYWDHQRNEGEPVFSEFLSLLDSDPLKQLAIELVDETEQLADVEKLLNDSIGHLEEVRKRHATDQLVAEARKTDEVDELELLRRLSDHKKQPDLRKVL